MSLLVDGALAPGGNTPGFELAPGETNGVCKAITLPTSGRHRLALVVDQERAVAELNEHNNRLEQDLDRTPLGQTRPPVGPSVLNGVGDPPPDPGPGGPILSGAPETGPGSPAGPFTVAEPLVISPTAATANLEVKAIRVKGNEPRGVNDCDPGQNDVIVVVKNEGTAAAANLLVRLTVGNQTKEKAASNLAAGGELNVSFDDLMLTQGQHKLTATANVPNPAALTLQDDAKLEVNVSCANE